jgi:DNA repair protein RAD50
MESIRSEITASTTSRASIESVITELNTEIAKADSLKSNISANIRYRKEEKEIGKVQEEIEGIDIESAAKSRKEFNSVYKKNLEEETEYQNNVSWSGGWVGVTGRGKGAGKGGARRREGVGIGRGGEGPISDLGHRGQSEMERKVGFEDEGVGARDSDQKEVVPMTRLAVFMGAEGIML